MSKAKAKEKPKKIDPKELEAQRLIEEARRREEEERKRQEELRRYEVIQLPTGLRLILTEYCICESSKNQKPKDFFIDFMNRYFKKENLSDKFESVEVNIVAEFHLFNLIFAKEELALDDYRTTILLNLFWELLIQNNPNYDKTDLMVRSTEIGPKTNKSSILFKSKTLAGDYKHFSDLLKRHTAKLENITDKCLNIFDLNQMKRILDFAVKGYFSHYKLYQNILNNKQKNQEIEMIMHVDMPINIPPLHEALYMGKDRIEVKDEEEEYNKEIKEKLEKIETLKREEEEKKKKEIEKEKEEKTMNSKTMRLIMENIKEGQKGIQNDMKEKDKDLEKKVDVILNPKKK